MYQDAKQFNDSIKFSSSLSVHAIEHKSLLLSSRMSLNFRTRWQGGIFAGPMDTTTNNFMSGQELSVSVTYEWNRDMAPETRCFFGVLKRAFLRACIFCENSWCAGFSFYQFVLQFLPSNFSNVRTWLI